MTTWFFRIAILVVTTCSLNGCMLGRLQDDLKRQDEYRLLAGTVESSSPHQKPIQVIVARLKPSSQDDWEIVRRAILHQPGPFQFYVLPDQYFLGAFEDANEDLVFQRDEFIGLYGPQGKLKVEATQNYEGLKIKLLAPSLARRQFPAMYANPNAKPADISDNLRLGEVVTLDNHLFTPEKASMGFWEPLKFFDEIGAGIFFLEEYDPRKTPVLFVHGAVGEPAAWAPFIKALDQKHFQPWLLYYPSGFRLGNLSKGISSAMSMLKLRYKVEHLYFVAHSMGGLVTRGIIQEQMKAGNDAWLKLFVSISTPWNGDDMAGKGVRSSPVVIPSWYDMVPGSPFIEHLFADPLPAHMNYYLYFSYRGAWSVMTKDNNDGTVSLHSQLFNPAQKSAIQVRGFDEDHGTILTSSEVVEQVIALLENRRQQDVEGNR